MIRITKKGFERLEQGTPQEFVAFDCLREDVTEVEEGVTLEDIIVFTARDEALRQIVNIYSGCNVMDFYNELKKGVNPFDPSRDIQYCTIAFEVEITEVSGPKPVKEIEANFGFYGCSSNKKTWALDLAPLAKIAALPFRLETNSTLSFLRENNDEVETGLKHTPRLLELLDAIFFDLSFHGSSEEKAERLSILDEAMKSLHDGTAKSRPLNFPEIKWMENSEGVTLLGGVAMTQDANGPSKCPECGSTKFELRNYEMMWHEGDIHCAQCGKYIRRFDAG